MQPEPGWHFRFPPATPLTLPGHMAERPAEPGQPGQQLQPCNPAASRHARTWKPALGVPSWPPLRVSRLEVGGQQATQGPTAKAASGSLGPCPPELVPTPFALLLKTTGPSGTGPGTPQQGPCWGQDTHVRSHPAVQPEPRPSEVVSPQLGCREGGASSHRRPWRRQQGNKSLQPLAWGAPAGRCRDTGSCSSVPATEPSCAPLCRRTLSEAHAMGPGPAAQGVPG